jgi:mannitol/fructose-specific phosphotransferase system IIA component (Ntr-type)
VSSRVEPKLSEVLASGVLAPSLRCRGLDEALRRLLAPPLASAGWPDDRLGGVLDAVMQRERSCSTALGPVALPHARVPGLDRIVAGLGANADGVFEGDGATSFVLAFASPAQSAAEHLRFLARAAQLFRDEDARQHLLAARDASEMLAAIRRVEK